MLKVENVEVLGWDHAIRGMRNPKNSWAKSDSGTECPYWKEKCCGECQQNFCIGPNDKQLMMSLRNAGTDHRKFMRMITVSVLKSEEQITEIQGLWKSLE